MLVTFAIVEKLSKKPLGMNNAPKNVPMSKRILKAPQPSLIAREKSFLQSRQSKMNPWITLREKLMR